MIWAMWCNARYKREFRDSGSNINTEICFEIRATALRPRLHTKGFPLCPHRTSHTGNPHWGLGKYKLGVYNSSLQHNHLYTRGKAQSQNNNLLYTKSDKALSQTQPQSPLHKEGYPQTQSTTSATLRGIGTNQSKKKVTILVISKTINNLGDLNGPQTIFPTKIRSYR